MNKLKKFIDPFSSLQIYFTNKPIKIGTLFEPVQFLNHLPIGSIFNKIAIYQLTLFIIIINLMMMDADFYDFNKSIS